MFREKIEELLVGGGLLTNEQFNRALSHQKDRGGKLSKILVDLELVDEKKLAMAMGSHLGIPVLSLAHFKIDPNVVKLIPREMAVRFEMIPISKIGKTLTVATDDALNIQAFDDVALSTGCSVKAVISSAVEINQAIEQYYPQHGEIQEILEEVNPDDLKIITLDRETVAVENKAVEDTPVVKMMELVVEEAIRQRASDIHFEPYESRLRIRYRIDGALKEFFTPPMAMHSVLMARLKIMSGLNITERRVPQDGRFRTVFKEREIDFRVSVLPTVFGEKAVLRILDKSNVCAGLKELGFLEGPMEAFERAVHKPYGMVLVTGPTGSGKSTTLYSILNDLNTPRVNIMTIEDPIEYQVHGITQTQVNPDIGLTFASGLRTLLRQSPDIILVGEIRDGETADIAVKAALTGHLVFSTLHTTSASGAVVRLEDMNVEPFLTASSVVLVAAQRLCRRICESCKERVKIPDEVLKRLGVDAGVLAGIEAYAGKGCKRCRQTGYHGRLATLEVLEVTEPIRELILARASAHEIELAARREGMNTLFENSIQLFRMGRTTLEEVLRVTSGD